MDKRKHEIEIVMDILDESHEDDLLIVVLENNTEIANTQGSRCMSVSCMTKLRNTKTTETICRLKIEKEIIGFLDDRFEIIGARVNSVDGVSINFNFGNANPDFNKRAIMKVLIDTTVSLNHAVQ